MSNSYKRGGRTSNILYAVLAALLSIKFMVKARLTLLSPQTLQSKFISKKHFISFLLIFRWNH